MSTQRPSRSYSHQTLKLLWGRAAGRCAVPTCRVNLIADETEHDPAVPIGEIAHLEGAANSGPRANARLSSQQRDSYDNLILLCAHCHNKFDRQHRSHSVEFIRQLKNDHEAWVKASLPERGKTKRSWRTVLLRGTHPIDSATFGAALSPDFIEGDIVELATASPGNDWAVVSEFLQEQTAFLLAQGDPFERRFAVFPLAPVSTCLYFGYLLTNRPTVQLFQFHRDERTWEWPKEMTARPGLSIEIVQHVNDPSDVAFLFELSASIDRKRVGSILPPTTQVFSINVADPRTNWLRSPRQLGELARLAREAFEDVMAKHPGAQKWHLLYAGPAPGAVAVGQQLNPTMTPPVQLYEYRHPRHFPSLLVGNLPANSPDFTPVHHLPGDLAGRGPAPPFFW